MSTFSTSSISGIQELQEVINNGPFPIRFPPKGMPQDEEWCEVQIDNTWTRIRFHDYEDVYKVPGLYETIFYRTLQCNSPNRISGFLGEVFAELGINPLGVRALDIGAGNGMSGEALQNLGIRKIVGMDILKEAEIASLRDRPWVYDKYLIEDMTKPSPENMKFMREYNFNLLTTVAALGFGDIPPLAFFNAFNLIADQGLVAFNIRDVFLKKVEGGSFAQLISLMLDQNYMELQLLKRYQHRLDIRGNPIYYIGIVGRKNKDMPKEILQ